MPSRIDRSLSPDADELIHGFRKLDEARHTLLRPLYEKYLEGGNYPYAEYIPDDVQLVPSSDFHVRVRSYPNTSVIQDVEVMRVSEPFSINIMGYVPHLRCYAFRGEIGLLEQFLAFMQEVLVCYRLAITFRSHHVRIPLDGLPRDLSYEEFAARAEVVDYIVWLKDKHGGEQDSSANINKHQQHQGLTTSNADDTLSGNTREMALKADDTASVDTAQTNEEEATIEESAAEDLDMAKPDSAHAAQEESDFMVGRYALRARGKPNKVENSPTPEQSAKGSKKTAAAPKGKKRRR